jgi:hypothetical protein
MLTVRDHMTLDLAGRRYKYEARRDHDARELLGYSPVRFRQVVNRLIDDPAALEYDAVLVRRLQRLREVRRGARGVCTAYTFQRTATPD